MNATVIGNNGENGYMTAADRGQNATVTAKGNETGSLNDYTSGACRVLESASDVEQDCDSGSGNAEVTDFVSGFAICSLIPSGSS